MIRAEVPALRDRPADIVPLFSQFCAEFAKRHSTTAPELSPCFEQALLGYGWPGNVRQLANIAERLLLRPARGSRYLAGDLHDVLGSSERLALPPPPPPRTGP
ncbi:MAG TPA: Fis family transcriptional regulator, partial [Planctomycetes bacterium]|nr:Fis family transcriptional regulator [Planctomycetota bacterium]